MIFLLMVSVGSVLVFARQLFLDHGFGITYSELPGAWWHLGSHFVRAAVLGWMAFVVWYYYLCAQDAIAKDQTSHEALFAALGKVWSSQIFAGVFLLVMHLWITPAPPPFTIPLSAPFQALPSDKAHRRVTLVRAQDWAGANLVEVAHPNQTGSLYLHRHPLLTLDHIESTQIFHAPKVGYGVVVHFKPNARDLVAMITSNNLDNQFAIVIDNHVLAVCPMGAIEYGSFEVPGDFSLRQANLIARHLAGLE